MNSSISSNLNRRDFLGRIGLGGLALPALFANLQFARQTIAEVQDQESDWGMALGTAQSWQDHFIKQREEAE